MAEPTVPPLLSLIVPVFNEAENVEPLVEEIEAMRALLPCRLEVFLVDDGSRDRSWDRIRAAAESRPWLFGLRFLGNRGQTAAMAAGLQAARGDYVAFLDADLQNDPRDLAKLLAPILAGEADVACGWRVNRKDALLSRTLPSRVANFFISRALGLSLHDVGCSLKVFRRVFLADVQLFGEMHRFIPAYAQSQGARIVEIPVNHRERRHGTSNYGIGRTLHVLIDLMTVKLLNSYGAKPAYFFGKIALFFFALGTAAFGVVAYRTFVLDRPQSTPMIFLMTLFFITSLLCLMSGLLAEISMRILHAVGGKQPFQIVDRAGRAPDQRT